MLLAPRPSLPGCSRVSVFIVGGMRPGCGASRRDEVPSLTDHRGVCGASEIPDLDLA